MNFKVLSYALRFHNTFHTSSYTTENYLLNEHLKTTYIVIAIEDSDIENGLF